MTAAPMIGLDARAFDRDEWTGLAEGFPTLSLLQTWEWGEAKARTGPWRVERGRFVAGARTIGLYQALVRPLPLRLPGGLAWINRAPLWHPGSESAAAGGTTAGGATDGGATDGGTAPLVVMMMAALKHRYVDERGFYLRLAPPVAAGVLAAAEMQAAGLTATGVKGWASAVLDLTPPLGDVRKGLRQKWRNCLNKGERAGLAVEVGETEAVFATFLAGHAAFAAGRGFATTVSADLLRVLWDLLPASRRPAAFVACHRGKPVAGALIAPYGESAEYLAGHTTAEGRALNAGQVLLWRAVEWARARGCRRLDLGGLDPDRTPDGIRRFKEGLNAVPYRLAGELDAVGGGPLGRLVRWRVGRARAEG